MQIASEETRLHETWRAFDRAAADYDGQTGNNLQVQRMRSQMWRTLTDIFTAPSRLLDLGCGTGIDVAYLAAKGYQVTGIDWSPAMVARARTRIAEGQLQQHATIQVLEMQELPELCGERFDGIYSNLGALNCAPDLPQIARDCAALLVPGGRIVASVIGRICPWEIAYYLAQGKWRRASLRWTDAAVPVPLIGEMVWTRYYTPRRFHSAFSDLFDLTYYRGWRIFSPPPYMTGVFWRLGPLGRLGEWIDDRVGALPIVRDTGDHFLMVMTRRS